MRILVQWTTATPADWIEVDSADWPSLAKRPDPTGLAVTPDDQPGYVYALNVQGVVFSGADHYRVEDVDHETVRVTTWTDNATDPNFADVWTFKNLAPDPAFGGAVNTRQTVEHCDLGSWVAPLDDASTRHGLQVTDALAAEHAAAQSRHGWREWTDGVPSRLVSNGKVIDQRSIGRYLVPDGTKTYYASNTSLATGIHAADYEEQLLSSTGTAGNLSSTISASTDKLTHCFTTGAGEPGSAAWPTGTYRIQLDATVAGANVYYGLLTEGGSAGHFARVNSGLTSDLETKAQAETEFNGTGLKLATTGSVSWSSGSDTDRFECLVAARNTHGKNAQDLQLEVNESDDFADGPWTAGDHEVEITVATGAGTAIAPTVVRGPAKEVEITVATGIGAAIAPTVVNGPAKEVEITVATGAGTAIAPTVNKESAKTVQITVASGQGTAINPTAVITGADHEVEITVASGTGTAISATVVNGPAHEVGITVASGSGTAISPTVVNQSHDVAITVASGVGTAIAPTVVNGPAHEVGITVATANATAISPTVVNQSHDVAITVGAGAATAISPTVVNGPAHEVGITVGSAQGTAINPTVVKAVTVGITVASGQGTAIAPTVNKESAHSVGITVGSAQGTAINPTCQLVEPAEAFDDLLFDHYILQSISTRQSIRSGLTVDRAVALTLDHERKI